MPWGPLAPAAVAERLIAGAVATLPWEPAAVVVACNTASVSALPALRAMLEPGVPVIGTVPAIKPAAAFGGPVAVWATVRTTGSTYQQNLVNQHAAGVEVRQVGCPGLAEAIEVGDLPGVDSAILDAVAGSGPQVAAVVLACTHYGLVADRVAAALPEGTRVFDSADAVGRQTLARLGIRQQPDAPPGLEPVVLLSGRLGDLPPSLGRFPAAGMLLDRVQFGQVSGRSHQALQVRSTPS